MRAKLEKICTILDIDPPETVVYEKEWRTFTVPRLRERGKTIILYKSQEESTLNWQICNLYHTLATRKSPRWTVRHYDFFMILPVIFILIDLLPFIFELVSSIGFIYAMILQVPFAGYSWHLNQILDGNMTLWKSTMVQAELWPEDHAFKLEKALKGFTRALLLFFISFAILFALMFAVFIIRS